MGVGTGENWLGFNLVQMNYWPQVIFFSVGFGWFVSFMSLGASYFIVPLCLTIPMQHVLLCCQYSCGMNVNMNVKWNVIMLVMCNV